MDPKDPKDDRAKMKIELIEDIEAFRGLRSDWNALLERTSQCSVFLTWEWLFTWWTHFRGRKQLFILLVRDDASSQLLGIAPWYIEERPFFRFFPLLKISFLGTGQVASDFLDLIISPGKEASVIESIAEYLRSHARRWDVLELNDIAEDSLTLDPLRSQRPHRSRLYEWTNGVCPYIPLPADYPGFLSTLSAKWRRYLKTHTQAVELEHQMRYTLVTEPRSLTQNIDRLFAMQNERFRAKVSDPRACSSFSGSLIRDFHCDVSARFLDQGCLKLYFLEDHGNPVAFLYAFRYKDRIFAYQTAFDCAWEKIGPGNVLFNYAIRDSIQAGAKEFHFLRGGEAYKAKWTNTARMLHTLVWTNTNLKGRGYSTWLDAKARLGTLRVRLGLRRTPLAPAFGPSISPAAE
jgi:CelD/BcsL family acetyltransferase involved in cellulose biosynthesis